MAAGDDYSTDENGNIVPIWTSLGASSPNAFALPAPDLSAGNINVFTMFSSRPDIAQQFANAGITELPAWMARYANGGFNESDLLSAYQQVSAANPWDYYDRSGAGKLNTASHAAIPIGSEFGTPLTPEQMQTFQQAYLDRKLLENRGGFGMAEAGGLGAVMLPLAAVGGVAAGGAAAGAGTAGSAGTAAGGAGAAGAAGAAGGVGVAASAADLGAMGGGIYGAGMGGAGAAGSLGAVGGTTMGGSGITGSLSSLLGGGSSMEGIWPSLIQGGMGVIGSYLGGEATKDASDKAADVLWQMYQQGRTDLLPLLQLLGPAASQFQGVASNPSYPTIPTLKNDVNVNYDADPLYQAEKNEMLRTLNRQYASRGLMNSSSADDAITRNLSTLMSGSYNRNLDTLNRTNQNALTSYGLNYAQGNDAYSRLLDLIKVGSGAASSAGQTASNTGNALAGVYTGQGQNQANAIGGMTGSAMGALNNYQLYNLIKGSKSYTG